MNCIKCKIADGLPVEGWFKTHRNNVVSCCAACYWLHRIMFLKCSYHPPINLILSYAVPSSLKLTLILFFLLWLCLPSGIFPSGFSTNTLCAFLLCPICATCCAQHILWFDLISWVIFRKKYKSWISTLWYLLQSFKPPPPLSLGNVLFLKSMFLLCHWFQDCYCPDSFPYIISLCLKV